MNHEEYDNLTALYALGALDGNDRSLLEAHLPGCADCRKAVQEYRESATGVAFSVPGSRPSAAVKERILAEVRRASAPPAPNFRSPWISIAAGFLIAILGISWYRAEKRLEDKEAELQRIAALSLKNAERIEALDRKLPELAGLITKLQKDKEDAQRELEKFKDAQIAWMKGNPNAPDAIGFVEYKGSNLRVTVKGMPALKAGKIYELWAFIDGKPVRAGEFAPDTNGVLVATYDKSPVGKKIEGFAMSIEVTGGVDSPTLVAMLPF